MSWWFDDIVAEHGDALVGKAAMLGVSFQEHGGFPPGVMAIKPDGRTTATYDTQAHAAYAALLMMGFTISRDGTVEKRA